MRLCKELGVADGDVSKLKQEIRDNMGVRLTPRESAQQGQRDGCAAQGSQLEVPKSLAGKRIPARLMEQTLHDMEARGMKIPKGMKLRRTCSPARYQARQA